MKKTGLWQEFKKFINKGNVIDLATGMIIGSSFTAVVTAVVTSIFKPLLSWIPGTNSTGALQIVLRSAVTDGNGNILSEALILDLGAVLSAVLTFFITASVLFVFVKIINKFKETGNKAEQKLQKKSPSEKNGE